MSSLTLEIPVECLPEPNRSEAESRSELLLELAIALYREGRLPTGRAATLAGLECAPFEEILRLRQVPMPYSLNDLEHDSAYARGGR